MPLSFTLVLDELKKLDLIKIGMFKLDNGEPPLSPAGSDTSSGSSKGFGFQVSSKTPSGSSKSSQSSIKSRSYTASNSNAQPSREISDAPPRPIESSNFSAQTSEKSVLTADRVRVSAANNYGSTLSVIDDDDL